MKRIFLLASAFVLLFLCPADDVKASPMTDVVKSAKQFQQHGRHMCRSLRAQNARLRAKVKRLQRKNRRLRRNNNFLQRRLRMCLKRPNYYLANVRLKRNLRFCNRSRSNLLYMYRGLQRDLKRCRREKRICYRRIKRCHCRHR